MPTSKLTKLLNASQIDAQGLTQIEEPIPEVDTWRERIIIGEELDKYAALVGRRLGYGSAAHYMCSAKKIDTGTSGAPKILIAYAFTFYGKEK